MKPSTYGKAALCLATAILPLTACGSTGDDATESSDASEATAPQVSGVWARQSAASAANGAVYMVIESDGEDALIGVSVDESVAAEAQIHETTTADAADDDMGSDDSMSDDMSDDMASEDSMGGDMGDDGSMADGMGEMQMVQLESVDLAAGSTTTFAPGGLHVMLLDLANPLETGSEFELELSFENAESQSITVQVRDDAP